MTILVRPDHKDPNRAIKHSNPRLHGYPTSPNRARNTSQAVDATLHVAYGAHPLLTARTADHLNPIDVFVPRTAVDLNCPYTQFSGLRYRLSFTIIVDPGSARKHPTPARDTLAVACRRCEHKPANRRSLGLAARTQAFRQDVREVVVTRVLVSLLSHIPDNIPPIAPVTAGQRPAIGGTKAPDEPAIKACYRLNRSSPPFAPDLRRLSGIDSLEIPQKDRASEERTADRLARSDGPVVACDGPLVRRWRPALTFPQNLQDGLGSGIALPHQLDAPLP